MSLFVSSPGRSSRIATTISSMSPGSGRQIQEVYPVLMERPDNRISSSSQRFLENTAIDDIIDNDDPRKKRYQHLYVLPVLLMEFLALALTRAVLPSLLLNEYGNSVYIVMGIVDFIRGLLAFCTCPIFGKISDIIGRRLCLFVTVLGTCAPVCTLALFSWDEKEYNNNNNYNNIYDNSSNNDFSSNYTVDDNNIPMEEDSAISDETNTITKLITSATSSSSSSNVLATQSHPMAITIFVVLLSLSGIFSSTFTLVFAYISDTVKEQDERVSAYGLALATFGLSFTLGPIIGGYLAKTDKQYVFLTSLVLTVMDLLYIYAILPESKELENNTQSTENSNTNKNTIKASISIISNSDNNISWNPINTLHLIIIDPFLRQVGKVAFLYYTGLWALISTLSVYAVKRFHLSPERLGELISVLGLSTMIAEAVLVRILVPLLGEKQSMKIGLISFTIQCIVLGFAYESWHLFVCAIFSILGNLVYPSLSSLVSGSVEPDAVGEALGAINGIKALTEGFGPLIFGSLMTISEQSALPGWPYLLAAVLVILAYKEVDALPDVDDDEYIHELEKKNYNKKKNKSVNGNNSNNNDTNTGIFMKTFMSTTTTTTTTTPTRNKSEDDDYYDDDEELDGLLDLSEVEESYDEMDTKDNNNKDDNNNEKEDLTRLPKTFASFFQKKHLPAK